MLKLNSNYSDYTDETDVNYPTGKAVNASSSESYDGTPLLAEFMNDVNAAHIAMYEKAYGNTDGITGSPDSQKVSQFADSVAKLVIDKIKAHADLRGYVNGVHGATSSSTAGQIVCRDANGRAKFGSPSESDDAARKGDIDTAIGALGSAASKTAGSAAGNVPLVGTALGTTNNNIVVTDTSGGLKPSGTTLGSAAGKTAGSAAGNVPLVGTALGTTNNNIVVTDTSGKLKPSGTVIGSAAGKTAGSAAGNVPLVGTALGTTNNNIVVTDTSGGLKPSGTTLGSAAGKTAGSAAGNVPLVGTALGTTDNNVVVTNTTGGLKPAGLTYSNMISAGNAGAVCSTAKATQAKAVAITGFALFNGAVVKVMFTYGNSASSPTLNVNGTGAKSIKVVKAGEKVTPVNHSGYWRGATTASNEMWQPLTILELMYDGTDWVICGNPEVESYSSSTLSYSVKANGLIEQEIYYVATNNTYVWTFPVVFANSPVVVYGVATKLSTSNNNVNYVTAFSKTSATLVSNTWENFAVCKGY